MSRWFLGFAALGRGRLVGVHLGALPAAHDPTYVSVCDVNASSVAARPTPASTGRSSGVPVALLGAAVLLFVIGLVVLCGRSASAARQPARLPVRRVHAWPGRRCCIWATRRLSILGTVLPALRGHVRRRHRAVPDLGSGGKGTYVESSGRAVRDLSTLVRTPAALSAAVVFVARRIAARGVVPERLRRGRGCRG